MNFPEKTINMIKNLYSSVICKPLINDVDINEFAVTSGVPQGCSLSGVLFNIAMIPLLIKLNCLPDHTNISLYQLEAEKFLTQKGSPILRNIASAYADDVISVIRIDMENYIVTMMIGKIF